MKKLKILPLSQILGPALSKNDDREFKGRNYVYASELGKGMYDRYLSMIGVPPSNLPNEIAINKFALGAMIEDFIKIVLGQIGLLQAHEERVMSRFDFGLTVSGRLDAIYGGKVNEKDIDKFIKDHPYLSFIKKLSISAHEFAEKNKKVVFDMVGLEIKSASKLAFDRIYERGSPEVHHQLQCFHYAYWKQMPFQLVYFDKENGRIIEFSIMPDDKELYKLYCEDIIQITRHYETKTPPEKEKLLSFKNGKFSDNWNILYSNYLTAEYFFDTKEEYKAISTPLYGRWNRVLARIREGKDMTADNLSAIRDMQAAGYDIGMPEVVDITHEVLEENEPKPKETTIDKMSNLKKLLG